MWTMLVAGNSGALLLPSQPQCLCQEQGRLIPNGTDVKWLSSRGPLHRLIGRSK